MVLARNSFTFSWQEVMEHIVEKTDETRRRWGVAIKDKNFDRTAAIADVFRGFGARNGQVRTNNSP